jgi:hypothetical protein
MPTHSFDTITGKNHSAGNARPTFKLAALTPNPCLGTPVPRQLFPPKNSWQHPYDFFVVMTIN